MEDGWSLTPVITFNPEGGRRRRRFPWLTDRRMFVIVGSIVLVSIIIVATISDFENVCFSRGLEQNLR